MAGKEATAPEIETALETAEPAAGARIGESLVAVVDLLTIEARPVAAGNTSAVAAGVGQCQGVADALVQRAQCREAELPRDRLHHARGRKFRPMIGQMPGGKFAGGGSVGKSGPTGPGPGPGPGSMNDERRASHWELPPSPPRKKS